jgi:Tol biopolymer transport system component
MKPTRTLAVASMLLASTSTASAQIVTRCSVDSSGAQANASSSANSLPSVSADGRWIAFESGATNLVAGDTNSSVDVFVHDLLTGSTVCASVDPSGAVGNNISLSPSISGDGRWVAFSSGASNLVPGDTNNNFTIFLRDLQTGVTEIVNLDPSGAQGVTGSLEPSVSSDGRYVAFTSAGLNLVPGGDANGSDRDIFVRDRVAGTIVLADVSAAGVQAIGFHSEQPSISGDGRRVAFVTGAANLVPGDTNNAVDVFVRDLALNTTTRVSVGTAGAQADGPSSHPRISADGRFVAFESQATNLVAGDTNGLNDVFLHDLVTGSTVRVSVTSAGLQAGGPSSSPGISSDGAWVTFDSDAANLVAGDTNFLRDVFLHEVATGITKRAGLTHASAQVHDGTFNPAISADARFVAFVSFSADVVTGDTNSTWDVFLRGTQPTAFVFCAGDGSTVPCPCANNGAPGHGCDNSMAGLLGAELGGGGNPSLSSDTLTLSVGGDIGPQLCILLQGNATIAPVNFGDGLRCVAGTLLRLYVVSNVQPPILFPGSSGAGLPISVRSAALGDPIPAGGVRHYQAYYRDPTISFCPRPAGDTFNITNGLSVTWMQ